MKSLARWLTASTTALTLGLAMSGTAYAEDLVVSTGYANGGFVSYGDKVWVEHFESGYSTMSWYTDYGRSGSCTGTALDVPKWCNYDMRETGRITLRLCSYPVRECTEPTTVRIGD
ncbi:hypothetical protein ABZ612_41285 [Streptomyces avermitilis]|uniref:hypothetical protein n=1 Tax=Streptomyces avermitilis TaxID=33903 RepID=UPI003405C260